MSPMSRAPIGPFCAGLLLAACGITSASARQRTDIALQGVLGVGVPF
jgi:hypothetical protein